MPNLQLRHPLAGAVLLIATSWVLHAFAADSEAPKAANSEPATISDPAPSAALSGAYSAPATTADKPMPPKNSQAVASSAPHVARVRKLSQARAAAPNIPAPKALASSRKAIRSAPRNTSVKLAATYDGRATRCSASPVCAGSLILGIAY